MDPPPFIPGHNAPSTAPPIPKAGCNASPPPASDNTAEVPQPACPATESLSTDRLRATTRHSPEYRSAHTTTIPPSVPTAIFGSSAYAPGVDSSTAAAPGSTHEPSTERCAA